MSLQSLQTQLMIKRTRSNMRYIYYDMKNITLDFGISTPPSLKYMQEIVGWCGKAVDTLADRLQFREFTEDVFDLNTIYQLNNPDILYRSAILSALICSCSFIYISEGADGYPRLQVIDGTDATGEIEPETGLLKEGYAVLERDEFKIPILEAYFTADYTAYYRNGRLIETRDNPAPYPLLVPVIYRPDAKRPFGHSRISRACIAHVNAAIRTIKRSEISAEFYSFPQRYATGLDQDVTLDKWKASMSSMMQFSVNDDGEDHVKLGQFTQQTMEPHVSQLRMFASLFAGETGLTLDDLGFPTDNPSSEGAIIAAHENLRLTARQAKETFYTGFLNAGYLAACLRDNYAYQRRQMRFTGARWYPVFEPDVSMFGAIGDAIGKIGQTYPDLVTPERVEDLLGW